MTVKDLSASSLTANGLLLRNNEITKNLAPVPSLLSLPSQNNSSNHTGSPPTPPNTAKSANSRIHENSEAKKGSRFSFSVDSLLSTVAQTKKPPTPTYSMLFFYLERFHLLLFSIKDSIFPIHMIGKFCYKEDKRWVLTYFINRKFHVFNRKFHVLNRKFHFS